MYEFRDLKKYNGSDDALPSEALNWNGEYLDNVLEGFHTLNVKGREGFSRAINAPEMSGDGNRYLDSRLEAKTIVVNFQLLSNNSTELQKRFDKLKNKLYVDQCKFYFADETNFYFIGTISKLENSKEGQLNIVGEIEITCSDPFKHSKPKTVTNGKISDASITFPIVPNSLKFVPSANANRFKVTTNNGMKIQVNRGIERGKTVLVDFKKLTVKNGTANVLIDLDLTSNLGDFKIKNGTTFTVESAGSLTIEYEVTQL